MKIRLNRNRWRAGFLAFQFLGGAIQKKTKVPRVTPIDPAAEAQKATAGNIKNFQQMAELGGMYNDYAQNAIMQGLQSVLGPNVGNILSQGSQNILSLMQGQIPQDVQSQVQNSVAARALGGGYAGSSMHGNLMARDLGLTSLQLQQQGQAQALPWFGLGRQLSPTFDVSNMFITPAQQISVALENQARQFSASWLKAQVKQAQAWETILGQAIIKTDDQIMEMASSAAGSLISGAMCWVAREVYGFDNFRWVLFREWLTTKGPRWLLALYIRFGERFAKWIADKPRLKDRIRRWMDSRIETL